MSRCMTIASSIVSPMQTPATSTDSAKFLVELLAPAVMNFEVQSPEQKARSALEYALKNTTSLHGFILRGVIGFGSNGVVLAAEQMTSENTSFPVAIKCIYKASSKRSSLTKTPPKEILTLRAIARDPHPSLLHYISDYQDHQNFYVITELYGIDWLARAASIHEVASCTLSPLVVKETGILLPFSSGSSDLWAWSYYERSVNWDCETGRTHLPFCLIKKILKDLCCAVAHMHEIGLFHGDIKAENVLVSATFESEGRTDGFNRYGDVSIRLCDFGHSDFTDVSMNHVGTLDHAPPEFKTGATRKGGSVDGMKADVYATGLLAAKLLTAVGLFEDNGTSCKGVETIKPWSELGLCHELVRGMLAQDPQNRWNMRRVASHAWFHI